MSGNVKIELSRDGGASFPETIAASVAVSAGSYSWVVTGPASTTCRVKVTSLSDPTVFDASDGNFIVAATSLSLSLSSPNGGENWGVGTIHPITWTSTGLTGNVAITLSRNGGSTYAETLAASVAVSAGSFNWTVTTPTSSTCRVKVTSLATPSLFDTSDANFSILAAQGGLLTNGGFEEGNFNGWSNGYGLNYGLSGSPPFNESNIQITPGGLQKLSIVGPPGAANTQDPRTNSQLSLPRFGNYTAKVNDEDTKYHLNYILQQGVVSESDRDPSDGKLHVRFSYASVMQYPYDHDPQEMPFFHVYLKNKTESTTLYDDFTYMGQTGIVFHDGSGTGTEKWFWTDWKDIDLILPETALGDTLEIRALASDCSQGGHGGYVYLDGFGSAALPPPTTTPFGAPLQISFLSGGSLTTWEGWFIDPCFTTNLTILKKDGVTQATIPATDLREITATATARAGMGGPLNNPSAMFYVPFAPSGMYYDLQGERGVLNFTVPNPRPLNNFGPYTTVADTLYGPSPSPAVFASAGWYYIVSLPHSLASETADGTFRLHMEFLPTSLTLSSPNGGESWGVGSNHTITWTSAGLSGNVKIELSRNGGSTYAETLAASVSVSAGSFNWTVSGPVSSTCRVKVTSLADPSVSDTSNGNFAISDLSPPNTVTFSLLAGWNMISLPLVPASTDPQVVFGGLPSPWFLFEWDPLVGTYIGKELISLRLGAGYWLRVPTAVNYPVTGQPNGAAQTPIDLGLNWNLIGVPYQGVIPWGAVRVSKDGGALVTLDQAVSFNWIQGMFFHWNGSMYDMLTTGGNFQSLFGYWVKAKVTGVRLVFLQP